MTCAEMMRAPAFSGQSPSHIAKVIAERISAKVTKKRAIRLTCEGSLLQSSRLGDKFQSRLIIGIDAAVGAAIRIKAVFAALLTYFEEVSVNADHVTARV